MFDKIDKKLEIVAEKMELVAIGMFVIGTAVSVFAGITIGSFARYWYDLPFLGLIVAVFGSLFSVIASTIFYSLAKINENLGAIRNKIAPEIPAEAPEPVPAETIPPARLAEEKIEKIEG